MLLCIRHTFRHWLGNCKTQNSASALGLYSLVEGKNGKKKQEQHENQNSDHTPTAVWGRCCARSKAKVDTQKGGVCLF